MNEGTPETYEAAKATVHRLAEASFGRHVLQKTGPTEWLCRRPGTGYCSFRVIVRHSCVVIYGDLGEGIFRGGEAGGDGAETLCWLREAVHSPEYLLGKLRPPQREFYPDDALDYARERAAEERERSADAREWRSVVRRVIELRKDRLFDSHTWAQTVAAFAPGSDAYGIGTGYSGSALWLVEALRWLVEALAREEATEKPAAPPPPPAGSSSPEVELQSIDRVAQESKR